jgi:exonuclease III
MASCGKNLVVMSWNVRGLGDSDKCVLVRDAIVSSSPAIACLQETKLSDVTVFKAASFLPSSLASNFLHIPAAGTRGGILTAWNENSLQLNSYIIRRHALTCCFTLLAVNVVIHITNVYAPSDHRDAPDFLQILQEIHSHIVISTSFAMRLKKTRVLSVGPSVISSIVALTD